VAERGRVFTEVVSRGAFDGIEQRTGKIKVNRDHDPQKPIGKIVGLHPSRKEGLVTEVRISATPDGDVALTLADDGVLDASAGFRLLQQDNGDPYPDAEVWERNRTVRRLNRLYLDHLALVSNPAYPTATVLDVRDDRPQEPADATPNLDRIVLQELQARFDALNARWVR
jgi:HK97 family phage prohead protease